MLQHDRSIGSRCLISPNDHANVWLLVLCYSGSPNRPVPKQSFTAKVKVVNGDRPYFPVLSMPEKVCSMESDLLELDQIRIERRYAEDEIVSVSLYSDKGSMTTDESINALCKYMWGILAKPGGIYQIAQVKNMQKLNNNDIFFSLMILSTLICLLSIF